MKLLFDQNLSYRLPEWLGDTFPQSLHVRSIGLERASDSEVWDFAASNSYAIVSKDSDFRQRSFLYGPPPKVIWLNTGNCTTQQILEVLTREATPINRFLNDPMAAFLEII